MCFGDVTQGMQKTHEKYTNYFYKLSKGKCFGM